VKLQVIFNAYTRRRELPKNRSGMDPLNRFLLKSLCKIVLI